MFRKLIFISLLCSFGILANLQSLELAGVMSLFSNCINLKWNTINLRNENAVQTDVNQSKTKLIQSIQLSLKKNNFSEAGHLIKYALNLYPKDASVLTLKKEWVEKDFEQSFKIEKSDNVLKIYEREYQIGKCYAGKLSSKAKLDFIEQMKYLRRLAGVKDSIFLDETMNKQAQEAAFLMEVNNTLTHSPNRSMKCYTSDAALAASKSNLSLGYGYTEALLGQLVDDGASNGPCGHRRWILNPFNLQFGLGSTNDAMALMVINDAPNKLKFNHLDSLPVAWPSEDYFPLDLVPERWSYSLVDADFSKAKVSISLNGQRQSVVQEKVKNGYALNSLVWKFKSKPIAGKTYQVTVSQIMLKEKNGRSISTSKTYQITFLPSKKL
jgi:hypothetical protein